MKVEISSGEDLALVSLELQERCVRSVHFEVRAFLFPLFTLFSFSVELTGKLSPRIWGFQFLPTEVESNTWKSSGSHLLLLLCRARIQCVIASDIRLSEFF